MPFLSNLMFLFSAQWKMATRAMIANKKIFSQWSPVLCLFTSEHPNFISSLWNLNRCLLFDEYVANCVLSPIMIFTTGMEVYCYAVCKRVGETPSPPGNRMTDIRFWKLPFFAVDKNVVSHCWPVSRLWPELTLNCETVQRNSTSNWSLQDPRVNYLTPWLMLIWEGLKGII